MMYEKINLNQWYWFLSIFALQMVCFAIFGHWFTSIYVDHLLGALFAGIVLSYLVDDFKTKELPFFLFPMLSIFMIKEAGMFFSFAAAGLFIFLTLWKNYQKKKE